MYVGKQLTQSIEDEVLNNLSFFASPAVNINLIEMWHKVSDVRRIFKYESKFLLEGNLPQLEKRLLSDIRDSFENAHSADARPSERLQDAAFEVIAKKPTTSEPDLQDDQMAVYKIDQFISFGIASKTLLVAHLGSHIRQPAGLFSNEEPVALSTKLSKKMSRTVKRLLADFSVMKKVAEQILAMTHQSTGDSLANVPQFQNALRNIATMAYASDLRLRPLLSAIQPQSPARPKDDSALATPSGIDLSQT